MRAQTKQTGTHVALAVASLTAFSQPVFANGEETIGGGSLPTYWQVAGSIRAGTSLSSDFAVVPDEMTFPFLAKRWHEERGATSSITKMALCPSYQRIIGMGPRAIPLILKQLESEGDQPDMWFWALRTLTNADPVSEADRGNIVRMANAWLEWGRQRYVW